MKQLIALGLITGILSLTIACQAAEAEPPDGVLLPYPGDGNQYTMTELCGHLADSGYNVKGAVDYRVGPDAFADLLDNLPALARGPVEGYIGDGIAISLEIGGLCNALAPASR